MQDPLQDPCAGRNQGYDADAARAGLCRTCGAVDYCHLMDTNTRGNYESGSDYVLEYGELRFTFNERDFAQRVEQAAVKLAFVDQGLTPEELDDLLDLAVSGEIAEPSSGLGAHINENWEDLVGPSNRTLVHRVP